MNTLFVPFRSVVVWYVIGLPAVSAQVSMSLSVPVPGTVGYTNLLPGPLGFPQSIVSSSNGTVVNLSAQDYFSGQTAPTGFELSGDVWAWVYAFSSPFSGSNYASAIGRIDVTLRLTFCNPSPFTGVLRLQSRQSFDNFSWYFNTTHSSAGGWASTSIDIGADGTFEHVFLGQGNVSIEFPVSFQSTLVVDVVMELSQHVSASSSPLFSASSNGSAVLDLTGELSEDYAVVQQYATTGATAHLAFTHLTSGILDLTISSLSNYPLNGLIAVGQQAVVQPLLPSVTQLVIPDVIVSAGQLSVMLPLLPSGTALLVQGFGLTTSGGWTSTRSLQVLWL